MRRSVAIHVLSMSAVCVAAGSLLVACEDGPNQTYTPATGTLFNNGDTPAAADEAGAPLTSNYGGTSKTEICSGQELQQQWNAMVHQPIAPPYVMAGVNVSGFNYSGLTIEQAENGNGPQVNLKGPPGTPPPPTRLCQPQVLGAGADGSDVGGSIDVAWGNNQEFMMEYAIPTHKAYFLQLSPGYVGQMTWNYVTPSDGKMHSYVWQIGQAVLKDGMPFQIDWGPGPSASTQTKQEVDELYRGIASNFAPDIYDNAPAGTLCTSTGTCAIFPLGNQDGTGQTVIGFRPVSMYFQTYNPLLPQPSGSTMARAYFFNIKYAPYSPAKTNLKMFDVEGPTAEMNPIGDMGKSCKLQLGGTFGDLINNCVNVFKDQTVDQTAQAKVLGNMTHDDQNFSFSVVGDNQGYFPPELQIGGSRQFDIIHDSEQPQNTAVAGDFQFDVRAFGPIVNDSYTTQSSTGVTLYHKDFHGSGAVWREWARLVQTKLAADYHALHPSVPLRSVHDPACYFPMGCSDGSNSSYSTCLGAGNGWVLKFPAGQTIYSWRPAPGCTGFEGNITDAYPNTWGHDPANPALDGQPYNAADPNAADPDNVFDSPFGPGGLGVAGFKPGTPYTTFCNDPGIYNFCGFSGDLLGSTNDLLDAAYQRVLQYLGNGDILNVPEEGRDYRFYFKQFTIAYAKYMASPAAGDLGQDATPPQAVRWFGNYPLDTDNLFFDSYGGGANRGEYADFDNADATHEPTDLELKVLLIGSNTQATNFYRRLDREERAIFMTMADSYAKANNQAGWALARDASGNVIKDSYGWPRKNADVFLSNLAGSPAIAAGPWSDAADANGNPIPVPGNPPDPCNPTQPWMKDRNYCATHLDADCAMQAPTDDSGKIITRENGKPLLADYCGIWNPTAFALGQSAIKIVQTIPNWEEAKVELPSYANPYDPTSTNTPLDVLVPWLPQQEGVGYPVATTGQQDVFVQTAQLDFTGQVITPVMDYLPVNPDGSACSTPPCNVNIMAYETEDFLGDVFVCYDPVSAANRAGTSRPGDILAARMYTSVTTILDWIASHPNSQSSCGLIVRYSPYNNYPDYITSLTNGVRLSVDQGEGFGRIVDATVFQPGTGVPAQP